MSGLSVSVAEQFRGLIGAFGLGLAFGALYDAFFILRVLFGAHTGKRGAVRLAERRYPLLSPDFGTREQGKVKKGVSLAITILLDFFYALSVGILFLLFVYVQSDGMFRLYYPIGASLGFFCYYQTVGRLVSSFSATIVFLLRLFLAYLFLFIRIPLLFCWRMTRKALLHLFLSAYRPLYAAWAEMHCWKRAKRAFLPAHIPHYE